MPQGGQHFAEWYVKVKEQADRCVWTGYGAKSAARDAILYQTNSKTLMKKIIAENLNLDDTIKYGLSLEQGARKVEVIRGSSSRKENERVAALEEKVRALQAKGKPRKKTCQTCTRPTHAEGKCPGKSGMLQLWGHFKGSPACQNLKRKTKDNSKLEKARAIDDYSQSDTDSESMGCVTTNEIVGATKDQTCRKTMLEMIVIDRDASSSTTKVSLLSIVVSVKPCLVKKHG